MFTVIVQTIGGLGLFILGMKMMTDGLQMSAGKRIKKILGAVSANRVVGLFDRCRCNRHGAVIIGHNGHAHRVCQRRPDDPCPRLWGMILGANVGTTMTAQLIAFKLTSAALPAIAIGVALKFFSRKKKYRYLGEVILGFGLLFFGMTVMKEGLSPIRSDPGFIDFFTRFDAGGLGGRLLCVLVGAMLTILVQSSSATIGLTMTLASQGLLTFPAAMALVLGGKYRDHHYR